MQDALRTAFPRLQVRLLSRDGQDAAPTWMETYALPDAGIDVETEQAIAAHAAVLEPFIEGGRHVEDFVRVDPA